LEGEGDEKYLLVRTWRVPSKHKNINEKRRRQKKNKHFWEDLYITYNLKPNSHLRKHEILKGDEKEKKRKAVFSRIESLRNMKVNRNSVQIYQGFHSNCSFLLFPNTHQYIGSNHHHPS